MNIISTSNYSQEGQSTTSTSSYSSLNPGARNGPTFITSIPSQLQSESLSMTDLSDNFESDANGKAIHKYHINAWKHLKQFNYNDSLGVGDIMFSFIEKREKLKIERDKMNVLNLPSFIHLMRVGAENVFNTFDIVNKDRSVNKTYTKRFTNLRVCNTETCRSRFVSDDAVCNMDLDYVEHQHDFNEYIRSKYSKELKSIEEFLGKIQKQTDHPGCEFASTILENGFEAMMDDPMTIVSKDFNMVYSNLRGAELYLDPICAYSRFNFIGIATEIQKFSNIITTASTGCVSMIDILPPNVPMFSRFGVGLVEDTIVSPSSSFVGSNNDYYDRWWVRPALVVGDNFEHPKLKIPHVNTAIWLSTQPNLISIVQDKSLPIPYWDIGCVHRLVAGSKSFPDDALMGIKSEPIRTVKEMADKIGSLGIIEVILRRGLF